MAWYFPVASTDWSFTWIFGTDEGNGTLHRGVDIAVGAGTPVIAPTDITITQTGYDASGYGNYAFGEDAAGNVLIFGHMEDNSLNVSEGDTIKAGDLIGLVDSTGNSSGNHLHFEVRQGGTPVDPMQFLKDATDLSGNALTAVIKAAAALVAGTVGSQAAASGVSNAANSLTAGATGSINGFLNWIKTIDYKRVFGNVVAVSAGAIMLGVGLYWLATSEAGRVVGSSVGEAVGKAMGNKAASVEVAEEG